MPFRQEETSRISDIKYRFWEIAKDGMYGVANRPYGTEYHYFLDAPYHAAAKSGTAQIFGYETYNVHKVREYLRDHKLMTAFAPYNNPTVSIAIILENGDVGLSVGTITHQILDYIFIEKINI